MSTTLNMLAWREILARVMEGFELQENVSPEWLVNPATGRRLKLDQLYPEVGMGVRFAGLTAKGQRRQSDWELMEEAQRNQTRAELCRRNGVELLLLDLNSPDPRRQLQDLRTVLSRLSRWLAQGERPDQDKLILMPLLAQARSRLAEITPRVRQPDDLAIFAELWRDREAAVVAEVRPAMDVPAVAPTELRDLVAGQQVIHVRYGPGRVVAVEGAEVDPQITVEFEDQSQRTFLASLAAGKLQLA